MIVARLHNEQGVTCIMMVIEPGNIEKLRLGQPIHKFLNEFIPELTCPVEILLTYTPDIEWVAKQMESAPQDTAKLLGTLEASLTRKPVVRKQGTEDLERLI